MLSRSRKACDNCRVYEDSHSLGEDLVSTFRMLVVEMEVLHSIVEEGEGTWLGICFDRRSLAYVTKENSVIFTEKYFD